MSGVQARKQSRQLISAAFGSSGLRIALVVGSIVDVVTGAGMMICPGQFLALVRMPPMLRAAPEFWPRYVAIFLFVLPWFYMVPALDPDLGRYRGNVLGAVYGRLLGVVFYVSCFTLIGPDCVFLVLGMMNLLFAVYYLIAVSRLSTKIRR